MSSEEIKPSEVQAETNGGVTAMWLQLLLIVFVSIIVFVVMRGTEKYFFEKDIIAVDLKVVLTKELEKSGSQIMTEEQRNQRASAFNQALETALDKASNNGHKIILVSPAVVSGVSDYTQFVIDEVFRSLEERQKQGANSK